MEKIGLAAIVFLAGLAGAGPAAAGGSSASIEGPERLLAGERARYRVTVTGDPRSDACDVALEVTVPAGLEVGKTSPPLFRRGDPLTFAALPILRAGEAASFDLELTADDRPLAGALCARVAYGACPDPAGRDLEDGPVCRSLVVVVADGAGPGSPPPPAPAAPAAPAVVKGKQAIDCARRIIPVVTPGGNTYNDGEWSGDCKTESVTTTPPALLQMKTGGDKIYLSVLIDDPTAQGSDEVRIFVNANDDGGAPEAVDRMFLVRRIDLGSEYAGSVTGFDQSIPANFVWEVAERPGGVGWAAELAIPFTELGALVNSRNTRVGVQVWDGGQPSTWPSNFNGRNEAELKREDFKYCLNAPCGFLTWAQRIDDLDPGKFLKREDVVDDVNGLNGSYAEGRFASNFDQLRVTGFDPWGAVNPVSSVELLLGLWLDKNKVKNDKLVVDVFLGGVSIYSKSLDGNVLNPYLGQANAGILALDLTAIAHRWDIADFAPAADLDVRLRVAADGGYDGTEMYLDAIGFRVIASNCGTPSGAPDLFLRKDDGFSQVRAGQTLTYQIQLGNRGNATATGVVIVDQIPANTTYVRGGAGVVGPPGFPGAVQYSNDGSSWRANDNGSPTWIQFTLPYLPASGATTYTAAYQVTVSAGAAIGERVQNDASVTAGQSDANPADNADSDDGATPGDGAGDVVAARPRSGIALPCVGYPAAADGVIAGNEYQYAAVLTGSRPGSADVIRAYLQHDRNYLYVALDIDDVGAGGAAQKAYLAIDNNDNKLDPDDVGGRPDRMYQVDRAGSPLSVVTYQGHGTSSDGLFWDPANSQTLIAQAPRPGGWVAEFAIPLDRDLNISSTAGTVVVGLGLFSYSPGRGTDGWASYPGGADLDWASSWADGFFDGCAPIPDFGASVNCAGAPTTFTDRSINSPTSWTWDFGDASGSSSVRDPVHVYSQGGTYNVTLTACNGDGCTAKTLPVVVNRLPLASFTPGTLKACVAASGDTVIPLDGSASLGGDGSAIADPAGFAWSTTLGTIPAPANGRVTTLVIPAGAVPPAQMRQASVTLKVTDANGCEASSVVVIELDGPPLLSVSVDPPQVCGDPDGEVRLTLTATAALAPGATAAAWIWTVPGRIDGDPSGPVVTWVLPAGTFGTQIATVRLRDSNGCESEAQAPVTVHTPPTAALAALPSRRCADPAQDMIIDLDATGSIPGSGAIQPSGYGFRSPEGSLQGAGPGRAQLTLPAGFFGSFEACVDLVDGLGCTASACAAITVDRPPVASLVIVQTQDCADDVNPIVIGLDASGSWSPAGIVDPDGYAWSASPIAPDAGLGSQTTLTLPPGFRGVAVIDLTVTDAAGCATTIRRTVTISDGPVPAVAPLASEVCGDALHETRLALDACASSSPAGIDPPGWSWSVTAPARIEPPAGCRATLVIPGGYAGSVDLLLGLTDLGGCRREWRHSLTVLAPPVAAFIADRSDACLMPGSATVFQLDASGSRAAAGIADPAGYVWRVDPPGVGVSPAVGPRVTVTAPAGFHGPIDVTAEVTDARGCVDATTRRLFVHEGPTVRVLAIPAEACVNPVAPVSFLVDATLTTSPDGGSGISFSTPVGAASLTTVSPGVSRLDLPAGFVGVVPVDVTATDDAGCSSTATIPVIVNPLPVADLQVDAASACDRTGNGALFQLDASGSFFVAAASPFAWSATAGTVTPIGNGDRAELQAPPGWVGTITVTVTVTDAKGCAATISKTVDVAAGPTARITQAPAAICSPIADQLLTLSASDSVVPAGVVSYAWTAGPDQPLLTAPGGASTGLRVPQGRQGDIVVTLTVTDRLGCVGIATVRIEVLERPAAAIAVAPAACAPSAALTGAASSAAGGRSIAGYVWSIDGPGTIAPPTGVTVTATYPPGSGATHSATLVVTDSAGCQGTATVPFTIHDAAPPAAVLAWRLVSGGRQTATAVCGDAAGPTVIEIDATGSTAGTSTWSASPGSLAPVGTMVRTLSIPAGTSGPVTAGVTVTDAQGCAATASAGFLVVAPPQAVATLDAPSKCETEPDTVFQISASGSSSRHPSDPALAYQWSASVATADDPIAADTILRVPGLGASRVIPVSLVVRDAAGCESLPASLSPSILAPARLGLTVFPAEVGQRTSFTATVSGGSPPFAYTWDFGDGGTSSAPSPTHVYRAAGSYRVTITVADGGGCPATTGLDLAIGARLTGQVFAGLGCVDVPLGLEADIQGGAPPYRCQWSFGDGTSASSGAIASHAYANAGRFPVAATCTDAGGNQLKLDAEAIVEGPPSLAPATSGPAIAGEPQSFTATVRPPGAVPQWTFSDGASATGETVSHVFAASGPAAAVVVVSTKAGCRAEARIGLDIDAGRTDLALSKSVAPAEVSPGGEVEYALTLRSGPGRVTRVVLQDHLPDGFAYRPGTLAGTGVAMGEPAGAGDLVLPSFDLAAGATAVLRYRVRVGDDVLPGSYDNRAELTALDASGHPLYLGPRVAAVRVVGSSGAPDLQVTKTAEADPSPATPGGLVRYRIQYQNRGAGTATQVVLHDDWPAGVASVEQNDDGGVVIGGRIEWLIPRLLPGQSGAVGYSLRLKPDLASGTPVRNTVVISASQPDERPRDNQSSADLTIGGLPDLVVSKTVATAPDPPAPRAVATYVVTYRNNGGATAAAAVLVDDYDETRLEIQALPAGGEETGGKIQVPLGDLAPGASGTLTYTARVKDGAGGAIENQVQISSPSGDAAPASNHASARFDVALVEAGLELGGDVVPNRRCVLPQVEIAVQSDLYDTAGAMYAAAELLGAARRIEPAAGGLAFSLSERLSGRLIMLGRVNVEELLLRSRMGLPMPAGEGAGGTAGPLALAFASAHVPARGRSPLEPWCDHAVHREVTLAAVGESLGAVAAFGEWARGVADPRVGETSRRLLAGAGAAVDLMDGFRHGRLGAPLERLPGRVLVSGDSGGEPILTVADSRASLADEAVLARGLGRLVATARTLDDSVLASRASTVLADLLADLGRHLDQGSVGPIGLAALGEAVEAARPLPGMVIPDVLEQRLAAAPGADPAAMPGSSSALDRDLALARLALARGDRPGAVAAWKRLEGTYLDPRLQIYRTSSGSPEISYTPATLGAVVAVLARLAEGAGPAERATLLDRLALAIEKVAIQAGLQGGLGGRGLEGTDLRPLIGGEAGVRFSGSLPASAPVLAGRVSFLAQTTHHQDRPHQGAERGLQAEGIAVAYLSGPSGDCRTAQVQVVDRRFLTASGLRAAAGMERAGRALEAVAAEPLDPVLGDFGAELRATATADRATLSLLSGMGVRLAFAAGEAAGGALGSGDELGEPSLLDRLAGSAGLDAAPQGILPIWLPLDGGDPVFPEPIDPKRPYSIGWDTGRFEPGLGAEALGQALLSDLSLARTGDASAGARDRFLGRLARHVAGLKARLVADALEAHGDLTGLRPVLDAEGRPVDLGASHAGGTLRGHAALLRALAAYQAFAAAEPETVPPLALAPPAAELAVAKLRALVLADLARPGAQVDPIGLADAALALSAIAGRDAEAAAGDGAAARAAAARLDAAAPTDEVSPLGLAGLGLEVEAATGGIPAEVRRRYLALRDRFLDRPWRLFRSGREARVEKGPGPDQGYLFTDLDLGALLSGLGAAIEVLPEPERREAADLILAAGGRLVHETGLQRLHRVEIRIGDELVPYRAPAISHAVRIALGEAPAQAGTLYGGDLVQASFRVRNPVEASLASEVEVQVTSPAGLQVVPGSARVNGQGIADPAPGETLRFPVGRLGGGETRDLSLLLRVDADARAGGYPLVARAVGRSLPAAGRTIETAPVSRTMTVDGFGAIEGRVFIDTGAGGGNGGGNGAPAGPGVPEATVVLDDGTAAVTDRDGRYEIARLVPSTYTVSLAAGTLPAGLSAVGPAEPRVRLKAQESSRVDFTLRAGDVITGVVFRDENDNRRRDPGEAAVPGVVVETRSGKRSVTDATGRYLLRGIGTGSQELRIAPRQPYVRGASDLFLQPVPLP